MTSFWSRVDRERIFLAFIAALAGMDILYRIELAAAIYAPHSRFLLIEPTGVAVGDFLKCLISDLLFLAFVAAVYLLVKFRLQAWLPKMTATKWFFTAEAAAGLGVLILVALIMRTHFDLLTQLDIGLSFRLIEMTRRMTGAEDIFRMMRLSDILFVVSAPLVFFLALLFPSPIRRCYKPAAAALAGLVLSFQLLPTHIALTWRIGHQPVLYLFDVVLRSEENAIRNNGNAYAHCADLPGPAQMNSISLIDPAFVGTNSQPAAAPAETGLAPDGHRWNIMIFVMESTGSEYVFDDSGGKPMPMPFFRKICSQGLYLSNHFTTADMSAKAGFSIFTGLYPPPSANDTCMEPFWDIPTLNHYLGPDYDYFFIHPTLPTFWFPEFLLLNNGLKEMDSMANLPAGPRPDVALEARNSLDCFDFLQARLDRASEPFLAVYWSFLPHWPYSDYGPAYRIRHDLTNHRDLYYNNLRLLDDEMHRIWQHLESNGVAAHTIFVVVGDHGEAFGQHPGFWGHGFGSYDEAFRAPVVFWQPNLIKPQVIRFLTSHVDILPTLLDLLGVEYDPSRFQGYSVLRGAPDRKYIFTTDGFGDCMSAITPSMKKVTLSFMNDNSSAFDLAADPGENHPISRFQFPDQIEAILKFHNYQTKMLSGYNTARLSSRPFPFAVPGTVKNTRLAQAQ